MNMKPKRFSRSGLSLIEVIGSIALLVTMFVMILNAWTIHQRQMRRAEVLLTATRLLDQQMASWYANGIGPPVDSAGGFSGTSSLQWKTQLLPKSFDLPAGFQKLTVSVSESAGKALFSTEIVVVASSDNDEATNSAPTDSTEGTP